MGALASQYAFSLLLIFRRMGCCLRVRRDSSRLTRSGRSPAPAFLPAVGRPGGERRDESRLYVADFPCGWRECCGEAGGLEEAWL